MSFHVLFRAYADDNPKITLTQINKWLIKARIINKSLTTTDTAVQFKKFKTTSINIRTFNQFLKLLAKRQNMLPWEMRDRLMAAGLPDAKPQPPPPSTNVFDRLTDAAKYTGTQKQSFDAEGKGTGIRNRPKAPDGYVPGYKNKDTFDKRHPKK